MPACPATCPLVGASTPPTPSELHSRALLPNGLGNKLSRWLRQGASKVSRRTSSDGPEPSSFFSGASFESRTVFPKVLRDGLFNRFVSRGFEFSHWKASSEESSVRRAARRHAVPEIFARSAVRGVSLPPVEPPFVLPLAA